MGVTIIPMGWRKTLLEMRPFPLYESVRFYGGEKLLFFATPFFVLLQSQAGFEINIEGAIGRDVTIKQWGQGTKILRVETILPTL